MKTPPRGVFTFVPSRRGNGDKDAPSVCFYPIVGAIHESPAVGVTKMPRRCLFAVGEGSPLPPLLGNEDVAATREGMATEAFPKEGSEAARGE